jgi:hypothetical protein
MSQEHPAEAPARGSRTYCISTYRLSAPTKAIDKWNISDNYRQFALSFRRRGSFRSFRRSPNRGVSNKNFVDDDRSIRELTPDFVLCTIINVV